MSGLRINAYTDADAKRDEEASGTGGLTDKAWQERFPHPNSPAQVGQTPGYDPAARLQAQQWAIQAGVPGPMSGNAPQGIGRQIASNPASMTTDSAYGSAPASNAGHPFYSVDAFTHQPQRNVTDDQGGYFTDTSPQQASDIARRYAPYNPKTGLNDPVTAITQRPPDAPSVVNGTVMDHSNAGADIGARANASNMLPDETLANDMRLTGAAMGMPMLPYAVTAMQELTPAPSTTTAANSPTVQINPDQGSAPQQKPLPAAVPKSPVPPKETQNIPHRPRPAPLDPDQQSLHDFWARQQEAKRKQEYEDYRNPILAWWRKHNPIGT